MQSADVACPCLVRGIDADHTRSFRDVHGLDRQQQRVLDGFRSHDHLVDACLEFVRVDYNCAETFGAFDAHTRNFRQISGYFYTSHLVFGVSTYINRLLTSWTQARLLGVSSILAALPLRALCHVLIRRHNRMLVCHLLPATAKSCARVKHLAKREGSEIIVKHKSLHVVRLGASRRMGLSQQTHHHVPTIVGVTQADGAKPIVRSSYAALPTDRNLLQSFPAEYAPRRNTCVNWSRFGCKCPKATASPTAEGYNLKNLTGVR